MLGTLQNNHKPFLLSIVGKTIFALSLVFLMCLTFSARAMAEAEYQVTELSAKGEIAGESLNVRSGPGTNYKVLGKVSGGQSVTITGQADNGWYRIEYESAEGFVSGKYVTITEEVIQEEEEYIEGTSQLDFEMIKLGVILVVIIIIFIAIFFTIKSIRKGIDSEEYDEEENDEDEAIKAAPVKQKASVKQKEAAQPQPNPKKVQPKTIIIKEEDYQLHIDPQYFEEENKIEQPESIFESKEEVVNQKDLEKAMAKLEELQEEIERLKK